MKPLCTPTLPSTPVTRLLLDVELVLAVFELLNAVTLLVVLLLMQLLLLLIQLLVLLQLEVVEVLLQLLVVLLTAADVESDRTNACCFFGITRCVSSCGGTLAVSVRGTLRVAALSAWPTGECARFLLAEAQLLVLLLLLLLLVLSPQPVGMLLVPLQLLSGAPLVASATVVLVLAPVLLLVDALVSASAVRSRNSPAGGNMIGITRTSCCRSCVTLHISHKSYELCSAGSFSASCSHVEQVTQCHRCPEINMLHTSHMYCITASSSFCIAAVVAAAAFKRAQHALLSATPSSRASAVVELYQLALAALNADDAAPSVLALRFRVRAGLILQSGSQNAGISIFSFNRQYRRYCIHLFRDRACPIFPIGQVYDQKGTA